MVGRRTPQQAAFFEDRKVWSEVKLRILEKYLRAYLKKRGSANSTLYYVDGFAGRGHYGEEDSEQKEGSPVLLAKLAQEIADSGKFYRLVCINVELDPENFKELQRALSGFDPELVQARVGAFATLLPDILREIGTSPAVFFLDPFGPSPIRLPELQPLLIRTDTELLVNLNTPYLRRLAGFEDSSSNQKNAKLRLVSQILGEDPRDPEPEWMQEWRRLGDPVRWEYWAVDAYIKRLVARSKQLRHGAPYPIRETFKSNPKYFLVFATRYAGAIPIMNDLVCTEEDDLFDRTETMTKTGQLSFFGSLRQSEREQQLSQLIDEVHEFGLAHQGCRRQKLIEHFVMQYFGQYKVKHYRKIIDRLASDGRARFPKGRPNDNDPITFV